MKIVYLLDRFPVLSQTFILSEVLDHLRVGSDLEVVSIAGRPRESWARDIIEGPLKGRVHYLDASGGNTARKLAASVLDFGRFASRPRLLAEALAKRDVRLLRVARRASEIPRADIVHAHFGNTGILAGRLAKHGLIAGKLVTTIHGFDLSKGKLGSSQAYMREIGRRPALVLTVNDVWRQRLIDAGCDPGKIRTHHLGVDTAALRPNPVSNDAFTFSSVGRFVEKKGHLFSIRAFDLLRRRHPARPCRLTIIGDGPLLSEARELVSSLERENEIDLPGALLHEEALARVRRADAFLLPSITAADGNMEGIPISIMEAMALGKPVISTIHSGIPELVSSGEDGILVPERDVEKLSAAMEQVITDEALSVRLGIAARAKVKRDFDGENQGERLRQLYKLALTAFGHKSDDDARRP